MLIAAQIALVALMAAAYGARALHLARTGRPVARSRLLCAALGIAALVASMRLLALPGRELLYWRTTQSLLIGDLGCLLIAIGLVPPILAPLARKPLLWLAPLTSPPLALALWIANLVVWQWPGVFDATLRHDSLTLLQNALLIVLSLNMWLALLRGFAGHARRLSERSGVAYVLIGRSAGITLACIGIWSPDVYYPYFLRTDTASSTSPLADQGIAGAIMLAEMALIAIGLLLWMRSRVVHPAPVTATHPAVTSNSAQRSANAVVVASVEATPSPASGKAASNCS